ncbi:MAG TPA: M23 family metallopeptidase [Caulobacterales bacterium]|nr:M23 family metallopeptidase [Caulobacterales bacterium]
MSALMRALIASALLAACAPATQSAAQAVAAPPPAAETVAEAPLPSPHLFAIPSAPASGSTASWPAPELAPLLVPGPPSGASEGLLRCAGAFAQGGTALCRTAPGAIVTVDGAERGRADAQGWFVVGFDRDSPAVSEISVSLASVSASQRFDVMPRQFSIQRVEGLPPQTVNPTDPAIIARIAREREVKNVGFASRADAEGWLDGFRWPVEGPISGSWGNQRIDNGVPKSPHYGVDIAMPTGTPVRAPASGVVALAEPDMFLEGGLVLLDHGQGLISMYLHMSEVDVRVGQTIAQGDQIGRIGNRGRATGPHLCWRMKWRDRNLDPSLAILALANARAELASARQ